MLIFIHFSFFRKPIMATNTDEQEAVLSALKDIKDILEPILSAAKNAVQGT
jgi:hypothetical protein